ncbi:MAG: hypothetical protein WC412_03155 [Candidatus Omnitrophota bacterium]|jgi:hypothetical protein
MKYILKSLFIGLILLGGLSSLSYAEALNDLVDQFKQATDIKRQDIQNQYFGNEISASGIVTNVEEYNFFNEKKDMVKKYYRITTDEQKTTNNTPYKLSFLSNNLSSVKDIAKGQTITKSAKIIRIADERLDISIWLYDGDITAQEKELFEQ